MTIPTLTRAARRMLTALGCATFANDLAKTYDDTLKNHPNNKWAPSEIARYNAVAQATQEPPAWVPVAEVPEAWKDGWWFLATDKDGDLMDNPWLVRWQFEENGMSAWVDKHGNYHAFTHICDCIPRSGP